MKAVKVKGHTTEQAIVALQMALGIIVEAVGKDEAIIYCFNEGDDELVTDTLLDEAGDEVTCKNYPLPI